MLLPTAVDKPFTYRSEAALAPGTLVVAPLMGRNLVGVVWDANAASTAASTAIPEHKLKPVQAILDRFPPVSAAFMRWIAWVSAFTLAPKGAVLALAAINLAAKTPRKRYVPSEYTANLPNLTPLQQQAAMVIHEQRVNRDLQPTQTPILLDGVTGSGKTEVYFHAIADALQSTGHEPSQILILLPEIALTHQWMERFTATFGAAPTVWHSQQSAAIRTRIWQAVLGGDARVVVGARSALFLPFRNLALIVVDEEHDPTYKQDDGVLYHARDMAVARAKFENIPIVLSSATPSLETLHNVAQGRYRRVALPERFGAAGMPNVTIVDMLNHPPERGEFLSPLAKEAVRETLKKGQQSLLFLNRRGYAPLLLCRGCGHRFQCAHCSAWLVVHGKRRDNGEGGVSPSSTNYLHCHHCDHREPLPHACPHCAAPQEKLAPCGPGVERIAQEVTAMFAHDLAHPQSPIPHPVIALLSSDESIAAETWSAIERGEVDILIGTQMAARGHHFPNLTLVVVVDADLGLDGADLRHAERSFQLLHQLSGRAGRESERGTVLVQTFQPSHPVMQALAHHDRERIIALELAAREAGGWPPFGQLAAILLDGSDEQKVRNAARRLALSAPDDSRLRILGPVPAPLSKLRDQYRYRLLVKAQKGIHLQRTLQHWLDGKKFAGVRIKVDVNPYSFQ